MTKFSLAGGQAAANFAQRLGVSQLAKEHGDELPPTTETSRMTFSAVLADSRFELQAGNQLQNL
jgi:hypothetical protein